MIETSASIFTILVVAEFHDGLRRLEPVFVAAANQEEAVRRWLAQHERDHWDAPGAPPPDAFVESERLVFGREDSAIAVHADRHAELLDVQGYDAWLASTARQAQGWEFIGYAIEDLESGDVTHATQCPSAKALRLQGSSRWRVSREWGDRRLVLHVDTDADQRTPHLERGWLLEQMAEPA